MNPLHIFILLMTDDCMARSKNRERERRLYTTYGVHIKICLIASLHIKVSFPYIYLVRAVVILPIHSSF